jgi:hypothetical protein
MAAMLRPFSKRHPKAILVDRTIKISISKRLRRRIWLTLKYHDDDFLTEDTSGFRSYTSFLGELPPKLPRTYGTTELQAFGPSDQRVAVDLEGFVMGTYPTQVLDVLEFFYDQVDRDRALAVQGEINNAFEEEGCPWRMADGQFFQVDSQFLLQQVVARTHELLAAEGFQGALDEFREARNDLQAGDYKGAVHNACKSFESVLKTILCRDTGSASTLIRELPDSGFFSDIPEAAARAFGDQVLMALPFLRNRLGGHGQGDAVLTVPRPYSELAVHLAATFILFATNKHLQRQPRQPEQAVPPITDDEVPF